MPLPEVVDSPRPATAGEGTLLPSFARGAAILRAPDRRLLRLSWDDAGSERGRALPAGRYELVGYRLVAESAGTTWHVSGSALRNVTLDVPAGGTHLLSIDPTIRIDERVKPDGVEVAITGHERAGISIYRDGKRIPIRYERLGRDGTKLADGKIEYG